VSKVVEKRKAAIADDSSNEESGSPAAAPPPAKRSGDAASMSLEAKVALLEIEIATLKTENAELKRRLVEALSTKSSSSSSAAAAAAERGGSKKIGQPPARSSSPDEPPPKKNDEPPMDPRRARLAAAAADGGGRRRAREEAAPPKKQEEEEPEDDMKPNAVMLCNSAMEAYNEPVPNNIPNEKRLPLVKEKLDRFMDTFGEKVQILDLKSGGPIVRDRKTFGMRYSCVFRESGAKLKGTVHKRFYFDGRGKTPTFCLDFEAHDSLVTAMAGTPPDGKLGVRPPRSENLVVLYEETGGKLTRMWLKPDTDKLGLDPTAGEELLKRTDTYKAFEEKIKELRGGSLGEIIFNNYHQIPSVG